MRIAVCCLRLAVPEQSPDDRQREAMTDADARRGMTEVMNSGAVECSSPAQPFPWLRQVYERFARQSAFDDESAGRGFRPCRKVAQYHQGRRGFWSEVQRVYENRIWTSLPSSLRILWNGVLKPKHFLGVRLAVMTMSWISSSDSRSMSM